MSESAVQITAVNKRFGQHHVLQDFNLTLAAGQTHALLGRNGAGKTTAIRIMMGLLPPDRGTISVMGRDPAIEPLQVRAAVGYLAEDQQMFGWMRVVEILQFVASFYPTWDVALARKLMREFDLPAAQRIKHLSKGQNVRLGIVLALAHRPKMVILDDPALGLDPIMRRDLNRDIITHLQGQGTTVLYSSHLLYEVEMVANTVSIIDKGTIIRQAETEQLRRDVKRLVLAPSDYDTYRTTWKPLDVERSDHEIAVTIDDAETAISGLVDNGVTFRQVDLGLDEIFAAYGRHGAPGDAADTPPQAVAS